MNHTTNLNFCPFLLICFQIGRADFFTNHCKVYFRGKEVGEYFADIVVNEVVILELKAAANLSEEHELQLINYLKATDIEVGLLLNFGKEPEFERKMWVNDKKNLKK